MVCRGIIEGVTVSKSDTNLDSDACAREKLCRRDIPKNNISTRVSV